MTQVPQNLKLFHAHVLHRVTQYETGTLSLWQAVQDLRSSALRHGLVATHGRDEIEWIIGSAFAEAGVHYGDIRPKEGVYP